MSTTRWSVTLTLTLTLVACESDPSDPGVTEQTWELNYDAFLDTSYVRRVDLVIDPDDYELMQSNLDELYGGSGGRPGGPGGGGGGGGLDFADEDPVYVETSVEHEGVVWEHVGIRYKGNSSLSAGYREGNRKLPFRLDFDRYDDLYPETDGQRLHGFEKMTFASNYMDDSQIRETYAAELFRTFGVDAARTSFVEVYGDVGDGPEYWGLYTAVEDPSDDPMLDRVLGDHTGNVYKPESDWTAFRQDEFDKKRNEDEADFSDVIAAIDALHAETSSAAAWRADLEEVFDAPHFLRWLALNTVMQNWDTYGGLAHNYYLYGVPAEDGRLRWVPWDSNESLTARGGRSTNGASILHEGVGNNWPLISTLLDDDHYLDLYLQYVEEAVDTVFAADLATARILDLHDLVEDAVSRELAGSTTQSSPTAFARAADEIIDHVEDRHALVDATLGR